MFSDVSLQCSAEMLNNSVLYKCTIDIDTVGWVTVRASGLAVKSWVLVCWWWWFDWSFARLIAPVVTTTFITLSSNKIQNWDILVFTNPGPPGKWPLERRERERFVNKPVPSETKTKSKTPTPRPGHFQEL